ncbi:hypothetical protein BDN72DRAFT_857529 [Pluteus cervinus]|uniref:Uncharacterized protein n=1 Tax=Pluteus cervinus TaxID=181527 RepID=A0ACD3AVL1_9AGAR|nr:hypothetical protein BDN72DRAFT_857529 [Pluteus cervinus]
MLTLTAESVQEQRDAVGGHTKYRPFSVTARRLALDVLAMVPDTPPTLNFSGLSKEDVYKRIDLEIMRLKGQIRSLYSIHNSLSPISSLPNELLSKMFMHCCDFNESGAYSDIRPRDGDSDDDRAQPEMRLVVSWVSRHWRSVAVRHQPLWNLVVNLKKSIHPAFVNSCAARCQHLFVDMEVPTSSLLSACAPNASMIAYLKIDDSSHASSSGMRRTGNMWTRSFTLLETLTLNSISIDDTTSIDCPKLQTLTLVRCNFDWTFVSLVASTISKLDITNPKSTIAIPTCAGLLQSIPHLSECTLRFCFTGSEDFTPAAPRFNRVRLLQLKKLTLADAPGHAIQFLRAIDIPRTMLHIVLDETESFDQDAVELFCALRGSHEHVWGSIHYLQVRTEFAIANPGACLKHKITVSGSQSNLLQSPACQTLDFSALESLWITFATPEVLDVFSQLPRLRRLVLESSDALEKFVAFMSTETHDDASSHRFPALQELVLAYLKSEKWLQELRDALASRKIWGFGSPKLVLLGCDMVGIGEVTRLKLVVDDVEFGRTNSTGLAICSGFKSGH